MLPQHHFAISGVAVAAVAYAAYPEKSVMDISKWALFGGVLSAAMDIDIVALVILRSKKHEKLNHFRTIVNIFKDFKGFKDVMAETGVLKEGMISHLVLSSVLIALFYFFSRSYFIPAAIGVISHLITDLPNYARLIPKD
jgi:hypothetical protein